MRHVGWRETHTRCHLGFIDVFLTLTGYFSVQDVDDAGDLDEDSLTADVTSHPDADTTIIFLTGEGQKFYWCHMRLTSQSLYGIMSVAAFVLYMFMYVFCMCCFCRVSSQWDRQVFGWFQ